MRRKSFVTSVLTAAATATVLAGQAQAVFLSPALPGTSEYEGWADMTASNYVQGLYGGGFPGAAPWSGAIASNQTGSDGNGEFIKVSGNAYPATAAIYAPFTSTAFEVRSSTALSFDIGTIIFQIDIGPGDEGNAFDAAPTLNYNGGSQALEADFVREAPGDHPFTNPTDPDVTGTTTAYYYQWDLSGIVDTVTEYDIEWATTSHSQTYDLQVDVGDTFAQVVPEPGSAALVLVGLMAIGSVRVRRSPR